MNFLVAFILAALSGMGVGGGGLFALFLKFFTDFPQIKVQALNLLFFLFASSAALCVHLTSRRIYFIPVVIMIASGVFGSFLGSSIALAVDGMALSKIFGSMLVLSAIYSFFRKSERKQKK